MELSSHHKFDAVQYIFQCVARQGSDVEVKKTFIEGNKL